VGRSLRAVHPVVRTNPVTGWKSIFALGPFPKYINELHEEESAELLKKFRSVITENHDLQVRLKWRNKNDLGKRLLQIFALEVIAYPEQLYGTTAASSTAQPSITMTLVNVLETVLWVSEKCLILIRTAGPERKLWRREKLLWMGMQRRVSPSPRRYQHSKRLVIY
jgi:hypothetical protein